MEKLLFLSIYAIFFFYIFFFRKMFFKYHKSGTKDKYLNEYINGTTYVSLIILIIFGGMIFSDDIKFHYKIPMVFTTSILFIHLTSDIMIDGMYSLWKPLRYFLSSYFVLIIAAVIFIYLSGDKEIMLKDETGFFIKFVVNSFGGIVTGYVAAFFAYNKKLRKGHVKGLKLYI